MTGICGAVGPDARGVDRVAEGLAWAGDETRFEYERDAVSIRCALLPESGRRPPATAGDARVWLWGNVYGFDGPDGYRTVPGDVASADEWCAALYDRHGPAAFRDLNGDFFCVVHDRDRRTVSFVTDRLGTRDVYYTLAPDGTLVFSARIQSLPDHPAVSPSFDRDYLFEYFAFRRALGTKTPLSDVFMFPPGAVTTYDLETNECESDTYWRPRHRPVDRPFSRVVDRFLDLFRTAVDERVPADGSGALLLSGGSDSRLLLALLGDRDVTAYHLADWMSREARVAERAALTAGVPFELLRRDRDYFVDLLETAPAKNNFVQRYTQAHAQGFVDDLRRDHDYLLTNHMSDVLFDTPVPTRELSLGSFGSLALPVEKRIETMDEFLAHTATAHASTPAFLSTPPGLETILENNVERDGTGFRNHGVEFDSFRNLVLYRRLWPGTNGTDTFFRRSLSEHLPHHVPLLDARLLDFWLTIPKRHLVRHDVVDAAITRVAPDLAAIPHAGTGVPLSRSFPRNYLEEYAVDAWRRLPGVGDDPPLSTLDHRPWGNKRDLIRERDFLADLLDEHEAVFRTLPFLDREGARRCYEDHLAGENNTHELLALATFLEMPITQRIVSAYDDEDSDGGGADGNGAEDDGEGDDGGEDDGGEDG